MRSYLPSILIACKSSVEGESEICADWKKRKWSQIISILRKIVCNTGPTGKPTNDHYDEDPNHPDQRNHLSEVL